MQEVIDCINARTSPEELAIQFLMRHAKCRMALARLTEEGVPHRPLDGSQLDIPVIEQEATGSSGNGKTAVTVTAAAPASALAMEDSWAARFSQAYVAARHMSAPRHTMTAAGKAVA